MKRILLSAMAFGAMTTAAMAEPQKMTEDQMADVAGGVFSSVWQDIDQWQSVNALALDFSKLGGAANATATGTQTGTNTATVNGTKTVTKTEVPAPCCISVPKDGHSKKFNHGYSLGSSNYGADVE
jgi:hypothetical protein